MIDNDFVFGADFFSLDVEEEQSAQKLELREGELREVAVLFADIKGFSSISNLFDAETIHKKMDEIMKIFTRCIVFYGGVVDKYMGDGIMALFGAKKASEQDTERSIHAAIKMQQQLQLYNTLLSRQPGFENLSLGLRIGINSGLVSVGKIGQDRGDEFTVYGPEVNLASRMESNAPVNEIMMPQSTKKLVERIFEFDYVGPVTVKGFSEPIESWVVKGPKLDASLHRRNQKIRYVGREEEQAKLESLLKKAQTEHSNRAICVSVKGEAGLGKTRLIYEFESAHADDINVLHGACSAVIPSPLNLFSSMFENLFRISINEPNQTKLKKFEEAYAKLLDSSPNRDKDALDDVRPLVGYLLDIRYQDDRLKQTGPDLLSHLSRSIESFMVEYIKLKSTPDHTMVLILDDLHWIDEASSKVLENLLNTISRDARLNKLLLILMHRPDYTVPAFISLLVDHHEISLLPLSRQHIEDLIREFTGELNLSQENLETVIRLSEGNPFFLEEWCNYIDELPKDQLKDFPVPVNLHTLILTRLDKLSVPLRMLLYKAAVIGNEFFVEILRRVENRLRDPLDIDATLSELEDQSIILRMLDFEFQSYYFKHITTREVAYQTLLVENRKMLHQLTGEAIEEIFADRIDEFIFTLAEHYSKADVRNKALFYLQKAADYASKIYNNKQALQLYGQILAILPTNEMQRRLETRFRIAEIQWMTGNWKDSIPEVEAILQACVSSSCRELAFEAHRFLGIAAFYKGDIDAAFKELSSSHEIAVELNDKRLLCIASGNLGNWYFQTKDNAKAKELQRTGLELAAELSDAQRQAKALSNLGLINLEEGDFAAAEQAMIESLNIAQTNRLMKEESIALGNLGYIFIKQSRNDEAIPYLKKKLELAEAMNDKLELIKALGNLGNIAKHKEDYPEAISCFQRILELRIYLGDEKGQKLVREELQSLTELLEKKEDKSES